MEKKNTVLLTVIAVATLLVAVVGATFAYFVASNTTNGTAAGNTTVNTATESASLILNVDKVTGSNDIFYPGTKNFVGATASAAFSDTTPASAKARNYNISYTLTGKVTLTEAFASTVNWTLYESTKDLSGSLITCGAVTAYTTPAPAEGGTGTEVPNSKTQSCTLSTDASLKSVKNGTIAPNTLTSGDITYNGVVTTGGDTKYYYLVAELPETGEDQSTDATGKTITIAIDKIEQTGSAVAGTTTP